MILEYCGERKSAIEWAKITGVHPETIRRRVKRGLPMEEVLAPVPESLCTSSQPCWTCKKACGHCSWSSREQRPVKGWIAVQTELWCTTLRKTTSYDIRFCPEYVYDGSGERRTAQYAE